MGPKHVGAHLHLPSNDSRYCHSIVPATAMRAATLRTQQAVLACESRPVSHGSSSAAFTCRDGVWHGEFLQDFNVRDMCREVTLDGPNAQAAFDEYVSEVGCMGRCLWRN
jgi:hypothetical protein